MRNIFSRFGLNEDLSLKGLIKESAMNSLLNRLEGKTKGELSIL